MGEAIDSDGVGASTRLAGRLAIVTGGSSGIGRATCVAMAREGANVVVVSRDPERLGRAVADIREQAGRIASEVSGLAIDVRSESDMRRMADAAIGRFGRIDILVAAAGIPRPPGAPLRPAARVPLVEWDEVIRTNLTGTFLSNRAVLPDMMARGCGDIVNISSLAGLRGFAFDGPYSASKFGGIGLSEALAQEVGPAGVRVQVLLPGPFGTEGPSKQGSLPHATDHPPASRVAEAIVYLVTLPRDTRLVMPMITPLAIAAGSGWRGGLSQGPAPADRGRAESAGVSKSAEILPQPRPGEPENTMSQMHAIPTGRLSDKVVIVTGGTGGIGLATCRAAAAEGASVVVADVNQERIDAAVGELTGLREARRGHMGFRIDARSESENEGMVRAVLERYGRIDALVASAGILRKRGSSPKPLVDTSMEEWDEVIDTNLKGVFIANRAVLPTMIKQRSGIILNISSVSGLHARAHDGPYCASKFGVIGLSQSIAEEVRTYGIKVQAIMPDSIDTPFWEQNYPVPRPGNVLPPERVADLIVFMLTQPEDTMLVGPVIGPLGARRRKAAPPPEAAREGNS
jgi:NAD(P)-dependent dehydrogenase (short-subunit alcohol dehydrogenase family)